MDPQQRAMQVCPLSSALLLTAPCWGLAKLGCALMHPHPCLKPEGLTGIFSLPPRIKTHPNQGKFLWCWPGWSPCPVPHLGLNNVCKSFQCLHPSLTPSQLSWWLKARALAKLLGGHKKPSIILPTGLSLEGLSWGLSSLACSVQAGSQTRSSPSVLGASAAAARRSAENPPSFHQLWSRVLSHPISMFLEDT